MRLRPLLLLPTLFAPLLSAQTPADEAVAVETTAAGKRPRITVLSPGGTYADLPETSFDPLALLAGGGGQAKPFFQLLQGIEALAKAQGSTVLVDLSRPLTLNLPQLGEAERALQRVRKSGKRIVCYLENAGTVALQLAAQCDRVLMADMAILDFKSPAMSVMHFKDALDLLGVQAEMTRVGDFKGAVEPYVLSEMSPALREHYRRMLAVVNEDVVRRVATGRGLAPAVVRALQEQRLLRADEARDKGLVDGLVPWEGARRALQRELGLDAIELADAMPKKERKSRDLFTMITDLLRKKREDDVIDEPELVVLHLAGAIADGDKAQPGNMISGASVKVIDEIADNDLVKGVVVRINSPGGSATASEAIRRALERLAAKKPVVFSMGDLAASGGYWITCIGRPIVAEPGTITGSIGVFGLRFQAGALLRRVGVRNEVVALDDGPLLDAMDRPWSEAARARMQGVVDSVYDRFVALVADSRGLTRERVRAVAGGRVWAGAQAVELGLVDRLGGLEDALAMVRQSAGVGADVEVRHLPQPADFASTVMAQMFDAKAMVELEPRLRPMLGALGRFDGLALLLSHLAGEQSSTEVYALLPADVRIR